MKRESLHKKSIAVVTLAVFWFGWKNWMLHNQIMQSRQATLTKPKILSKLIMSLELYSYKPLKNCSFICMWKING